MNAASYSGRRQWLHRWDKGDLGGGMAMGEYQRVSESIRETADGCREAEECVVRGAG
ncbi:hypothetical protein ACSS6W_000874 [Trichoderma asperelloides]